MRLFTTLASVLFLSQAMFLGSCARSSVAVGLEEGAPCAEDGDCQEGLSCVDGTCQVVFECSDDGDCAASASCQSGSCIANGDCTTSADCPSDQICTDGICIRMGDCTEDPDCPDQAHCENGVCEQNNACTGPLDCPVDQHCDDSGICARNPTCSDDTDCALTQSCIDGVCQRNDVCQEDGNCPGDQHCNADGLCERNGTCQYDRDCPIDQSCEGDTCVRNATCSTHDDCPADQACVEGLCLRHAGCREDSDCDDGLFCTGVETCSITDGCQTRDVPVVDDGIACTVDSCDEVADQVVHAPDHSICDDNNVCTDDACEVQTGCANIANDSNLPPQTDGDCKVAYCSNGSVVNSPDDGDLPPDDGVDCTLVSCQSGSLRVEYSHSDCDDSNPCTADTCTAGGCLNRNDNSLVPPQVPNQYCQSQTCETGAIITVVNAFDLAPDNDAHDCLNPSCEGSTPSFVADNNEIPIVSADPPACYKWVCSAGAVATDFDDGGLAPADGAENCRRNVCLQGIQSVYDPSDPPIDSNTDDCFKEVCDQAASTYVSTVNDNHDHPAVSDDAGDCSAPVCLDGSIQYVAADDPPADVNPNNCTSPYCDGVTVSQTANDAETPPQESGNCLEEYCSGGSIAYRQDNADIPADDGIACTIEQCDNGLPTHFADDSQCSANFCDGTAYCDGTPVSGGCKTGADPVCSPANAPCFTAACVRSANGGAGGCVDTAINLDGDAVSKCGPDNVYNNGATGSDDDCNENNTQIYPGAPENVDGLDNDCDGFTDEGSVSLNCAGLVQTPPGSPDVFSDISVNVPVSDPSGGIAPYQLLWEVTQEPLNNSLALRNVATPTVGLTPVLYGTYGLRLTLSQIDQADQVCAHSLTVPAPPVGINATMQMQDSADFDLHIMHPNGTYADWDSTEDCHFENCSMCTVVVPGQGTCSATGALDWINESYSYEPYGDSLEFFGGGQPYTVNSPTLDVDNLRGCYDDAAGNRVCTPESISLDTPPTNGRYTVAAHYYGQSSDGSPTPYGADLTVRVFCRGATTTFFKTYTCNNMDPNDSCFVADIVWSGGVCTGITTPTRDDYCGVAMSCVYGVQQ